MLSAVGRWDIDGTHRGTSARIAGLVFLLDNGPQYKFQAEWHRLY